MIVNNIATANGKTVCHHSWDMADAKVACRQLGFTKTVGYWRYGRATGKVWLNSMDCSGSEASIQSCSHAGWVCGKHMYTGNVSMILTKSTILVCFQPKY